MSMENAFVKSTKKLGKEPNSSLIDLAITPNGMRCVSSHGKKGDYWVEVWDLESLQCVQTLKGGDNVMDKLFHSTIVAISPDGKWCAASCEGVNEEIERKGNNMGYDSGYFPIKIWDVETGQCLQTLEGHTWAPSTLAITLDGTRIISGSAGSNDPSSHTVKVWDVETGRCIWDLEGHLDGILSVTVTPDSRKAVSGSDDHTIKVWDLQTGECVHTLKEPNVYIVSVTPNGKYLISGTSASISKRGSEDQRVKIWNLRTGQCLKTLETGMEIADMAVTPDGALLILKVGAIGGFIQLWDLERYEFVLDFESNFENNFIRRIGMVGKNRMIIATRENIAICTLAIEAVKSFLNLKAVIQDSAEKDPLTILKLRLAKGEITKEEYLELKNLLEE